MEIIILSTEYCEELREAGAFLCYTRSTCAFKFIMIEDNLVIGPIGDHSQVYAAYHLRDHPVGEYSSDRLEEVSQRAWQGETEPVIAAGEIDSSGNIKRWESTCFRVETPHFLRESIQDEVTRLFKEVQLSWL